MSALKSAALWHRKSFRSRRLPRDLTILTQKHLGLHQTKANPQVVVGVSRILTPFPHDRAEHTEVLLVCCGSIFCVYGVARLRERHEFVTVRKLGAICFFNNEAQQ